MAAPTTLKPPASPDIKSVSEATPIVQRPSENTTSLTPLDTPVQRSPAPPAAPLVVTLGDLLERFVKVENLTDPSSHFTHRGVCTKCGWQTYQLRKSDALQLVRQHVQAHWRDVSAELPR